MRGLMEIKANNDERRTVEEQTEQQRQRQKDWKAGFNAWLQRAEAYLSDRNQTEEPW